MDINKFEKIIKPKIEKITSYRANINDWAKALYEYNEDFASKIDENRTIGFQNVERLNLPRYKSKIISIADFLKNPGKNLKEIDSEKFFISLIPKKKDLNRIGRAGINREEVMQFIAEYVSPKNQNHYDISINQFFDNIFGGTILEGQ